MASINLLPRKVFEITLDDGTVISGQFGTWALKRLCQKLTCKLWELQKHFDPKDDNGAPVSVEPEVISNFLLAAVEQSAREKGESFSYTDVHACKWIDELGGMGSDMMNAIYSHSGSETPVDEEKKTELPT